MGPIAYLNGQFLPADRLLIPVYDSGWMQGITISEQIRTFGGRPFRVEQHLARLRRGLTVVGLEDVAQDVRGMAEPPWVVSTPYTDPS